MLSNVWYIINEKYYPQPFNSMLLRMEEQFAITLSYGNLGFGHGTYIYRR